jgi:hypothetical protein
VGGRDIGRGFEAAPRGIGAIAEAMVGVLGGREGGSVGPVGYSRGRGPR